MTRGVAAMALSVALAACGFDPGVGLPDEPGDPTDPNDPGDPDGSVPDPTSLSMFAGNQTQLWSLDRDTLETELMGDFWGFEGDAYSCGGIALASDGTLYAVTANPPSTLYTVDPETAELTNPRVLTNSDAAWGTTMIPAGTQASFSTDSEMLVLGGPAGELYAVDVASGTTTFIGDFGASWRVSGDLAWVDGVGLMGTLDDGSGTDQLAAISLVDASVSILGDTGRGNVYGLASIDGRLWGLTGDNVIYEMDASNADEMTSMVVGPANWSVAAP